MYQLFQPDPLKIEIPINLLAYAATDLITRNGINETEPAFSRDMKVYCFEDLEALLVCFGQ